MSRYLFVAISVLAGTTLASAQRATSSGDVLGAHLNYGRGCAACHAPHSGAYGNGAAKTTDSTSGNVALWGADVASLYGKTITFAGNITEVLPTSLAATTPDVGGLLTCLGCHDGNYAQGAMMKNQVYETLPPTYGKTSSVPTLLGNNGSGVGNYLNEHPAGLNAVIKCSGTGNWDCSESNGVISMKGTYSSQFVSHYGFFVEPGEYASSAVVVCTTCHDPHVMNVVTVSAGSNSGLQPGTYTTMFFLRGPYNPADSNPLSNQTAQFCRQCHGNLSNEMNGGAAGTVF